MYQYTIQCPLQYSKTRGSQEPVSFICLISIGNEQTYDNGHFCISDQQQNQQFGRDLPWIVSFVVESL